jgi:hypothetical protein
MSFLYCNICTVLSSITCLTIISCYATTDLVRPYSTAAVFHCIILLPAAPLNLIYRCACRRKFTIFYADCRAAREDAFFNMHASQFSNSIQLDINRELLGYWAHAAYLYVNLQCMQQINRTLQCNFGTYTWGVKTGSTYRAYLNLNEEFTLRKVGCIESGRAFSMCAND